MHTNSNFRILNDSFSDSVTSEDAPVDYVVTGGLDDLVKVWELQDDKLQLKHTLEGHSLGVVSVAVSSDGRCKREVVVSRSDGHICVLSMCFKFVGFEYAYLGS